MAKSHDLFDDTTMTFGEHLEVLRVHVFRAVLGVAIAVALSLYFGDRIFYWLRQPVEKALRERGIQNVAMDIPKESFYQYLVGVFSDRKSAEKKPVVAAPDPAELKDDQLRVRIDRRELQKALGQPVTEASGPATEQPGRDYVDVVITAPEFAQLQRVIEDTSRITTFKVEEGFMAYMKVCFFSG
ncbi:MAG: twin-arginine translocase subunit TatC, partial [Planctomycetia bacterium]